MAVEVSPAKFIDLLKLRSIETDPSDEDLLKAYGTTSEYVVTKTRSIANEIYNRINETLASEIEAFLLPMEDEIKAIFLGEDQNNVDNALQLEREFPSKRLAKAFDNFFECMYKKVVSRTLSEESQRFNYSYPADEMDIFCAISENICVIISRLGEEISTGSSGDKRIKCKLCPAIITGMPNFKFVNRSNQLEVKVSNAMMHYLCEHQKFRMEEEQINPIDLAKVLEMI